LFYFQGKGATCAIDSEIGHFCPNPQFALHEPQSTNQLPFSAKP